MPAMGTAVWAPTISESSGTDTNAEPNPVKPWVNPANAMIIETNMMVVSMFLPKKKAIVLFMVESSECDITEKR
jgi:hypothetical protein